MVLFLGVSIWAIGAEVLHGRSGVEAADDIAGALGTVIGPLGPYLFYVGLLGAAWTTVSGSIFALGKMAVEALHVVRPARAARYGTRPAKDPFYLVMLVWGLVAVLWSLPQAPGFVVLVVVSHVLTSPFLLLIVVGALFMFNNRELMGEHVNSARENAGLVLVGVLIAIAAVQGITEAVHLVLGS